MTVDYMKIEREANQYVELLAIKDRLDIRLPKFQKDLFEKVAVIQGVSLTDFIIKSALDAAVHEIERVTKIHLSMEGQKTFVNALENPREFSDSIKERYAKYSNLRSKGKISETTRKQL